MNQTTVSEHIESEEVVDYFEGLLPEDRNDQIEQHFATCDLCTAHARQFRAFSAVWDGWTAEAHGKAYQEVARTVALQAEAALTAAIQTVVSSRPGWQARLRHWQARWSSTTESVRQSLHDAAHEAARVIITSLESGTTLGPEWRFALATEAPSSSSAARSGGGPIGAPIRGATALPQSDTQEADILPERVTVTETGAVEVAVDDWQAGRPLSLVLLADL